MLKKLIKRLAAGLVIGTVAVTGIVLLSSSAGAPVTAAWGMITSQPNTTEGKA
ncbi:hypothetical protein [Umezawaea tangerina]|uniref:hypothetical protein n=1 Tax=Umezawaea tangerina TaxID=84725 RepID=UPI001473D4F0|nr:hypothetical protein [Umezawaea tangerina]